MANTFNWCFIGTGQMARTAARQMALTRSLSHRITAAYSTTPEETNNFVLWFGGKAYDTLEKAVSAPDVDAVYIATPHTTHFELAMKCIELNKPVLIEKPFTLNAKQAEILINASKEHKVYVAEAMWTWFSSIATTVRDWITGGRIGDVRTIDIKYAMASSKFYKAPRMFDKNLGGGALLDIGIFPVSYCYNLLGNPESVECKGDINENGVDNGEKIVLKYPNDVTCNISVSLTKFEGSESAVVTGTRGAITIPLFHQAVKATLMSDTGRDTTRAITTHMTEFDSVSDEIKSGEIDSKFVPQESSLAIMKILDECRRQMNVIYPGE